MGGGQTIRLVGGVCSGWGKTIRLLVGGGDRRQER